MTDVALIGDSIRLNAEAFVREHLPASLRLFSPPVNCESSHNVAAHIRSWVPASTVDLVHLNCGLHDIRYDPGMDRPVSSPAEYVANLRTIFEYLAGIGADVVWATSTPIDETLHNSAKASRRYRADLLAYNALSTGLAAEFGFAVNDLYEKVSALDPSALLLADGVHYNRAGNALIGGFIAEAIRAAAIRDRHRTSAPA